MSDLEPSNAQLDFPSGGTRSPPLTIGIGFFGLPRATALCMPSIEKHILGPASQLGKVEVRYHLYQQAWVSSPRSGEDAALDPSNYDAFERYEGELEAPEGVAERLGLARIQEHGDCWRNGGVSLRNLLLQLNSLNSVTRQLAAVSPDIVVFVRPDLLYHDSLYQPLVEMISHDHADIVKLPCWQWGSAGYNDRLAICGRLAYMTYGQRIDAIERYLARSRQPLHSERLLRFAIDSACLEVELMSTRASRVRTTGDLASENFRRTSRSRILRWNLRELAKRLVRGA